MSMKDKPMTIEQLAALLSDTDLRGLDYLTEAQAARYAGVSVSQFRAKAALYGILSAPFMGRKSYRKSDIQRAREREWQRLDQSKVTGSSTGRMKLVGAG